MQLLRMFGSSRGRAGSRLSDDTQGKHKVDDARSRYIVNSQVHAILGLFSWDRDQMLNESQVSASIATLLRHNGRWIHYSSVHLHLGPKI